MADEIDMGGIPTYEDVVREKSAQWLEMYGKYAIRASAAYDEHQWLLYRDWTGFSPRGNIMAIAAQKKAGKTWLATALCIAVLRGEYLGFRCPYEGLKVAYFDTEQDPVDGQRILRRVHSACGWPINEDNVRFTIYHLREVSPEGRLDFCVEAIENTRPDLLIIDGVRDLLHDFNDIEESAKVTQTFMTLSSKVNCAVWEILHMNPGTDKMRGHIGTELGNKCADILTLTKQKDKNDEDNVTYKVEETDSRGHKDIHSLTFIIDDTLPYSQPRLLNEAEVKKVDEDRRTVVYETLKPYVDPNRAMSTYAIREALRKGLHFGSTKADKIVKEAIQLGLLKETVMKGRYRLSQDECSDVQSALFGENQPDEPDF